jgi:hypothetical protein
VGKSTFIEAFGLMLIAAGLRVAVLEAGELRGREQDWNASRKEVMELVEAGILSLEEATEQVIGIEFNPVRCGFPGVDDVWLNDVLTADYEEKEPGIATSGVIGLQTHGGAMSIVRYKDIVITELSMTKAQ